MTTNWNKHTYVCNTCDGLFEMTIQSTRTIDQQLCPSCFNTMTLLSVVDATILSTTTTKEEPMETTTYLQSQIDELKKQLASHQNCDYWKSENGRVGRQVIELINDAYDNDSDAEDILTTLCEIIDYNPTKTIEFTATMHFTGSIDIPRNEVNDFDLTEVLSDAYVEINNGNVVIDNYDLYDAEEC